jgi:hypothetical protein
LFDEAKTRLREDSQVRAAIAAGNFALVIPGGAMQLMRVSQQT